MKTTRLLLAAGASALVLTLAGCRGDDEDDTVAVTPPGATPSKEVPDSAGLSAAAFVSFILTLAASDESSEPLTIKDAFAVPPEDSVEPTPLV
jgi:hypothetical protein